MREDYFVSHPEREAHESVITEELEEFSDETNILSDEECRSNDENI